MELFVLYVILDTVQSANCERGADYASLTRTKVWKSIVLKLIHKVTQQDPKKLEYAEDLVFLQNKHEQYMWRHKVSEIQIHS